MDGNDTSIPALPVELPNDIWDFCYNASNSNDSLSEGPVFWVEGIGLSVTSLIGILGNTVTIIVLNRISLNNVFNQVSFQQKGCIFHNFSAKITFQNCINTSFHEIFTFYKNMWPFFQLIVMLCIIDSLFAGFSFLEYGLKKGLKLISYTTPVYVNLWPKLVYPLHTITNTLSLFVTLAIAIER